ncbi:hypothetical protein BHM03_00009693 [Ensete ventricosum]|nr:hypothetical protein BHM03_00009693 [Ensete ventricosum]
MRVARRGRGTRIRHRPMSLTEDFAWWAGPAAPSFLPSHGSGRSQKQDEQRAVGCRQRRKRERVDDNSWRERHSMRIDESLGIASPPRLCVATATATTVDDSSFHGDATVQN